MKKTIVLLAAAIALLCSCKPKTVAFELPKTADVVMYQVNPRVFAPEKSLNAVVERLDSIQSLGANVIWIMPIYPIGIEKGKNSPYCISDYKAIAPEFGTIDEMKHLVQECHKRGIGVILDWVANHTAWDHPWVKDHPDWYTHDEKTDTIIHPRPFPWYDVADLNYDNAELREAMTDAMLFWIKECNIDGYRCDVADGVPADYWKDCISTLRAEAGKPILMLAEGKREDNFTVGGFDMNYGWDFKDKLVKVFNADLSAQEIFAADSAEYAQLPEGKIKMRFTTNHDHAVEHSPIAEFGGERGSMAAWVASVFLHGGAMLYGSQDVAWKEPINFFHYVPVEWNYQQPLFAEYKHLINIYKAHEAFRGGEYEAYPNDDILLFSKKDSQGEYLVAVNIRNKEAEAALPESWNGAETENLLSGESTKLEPTLKLNAYEYQILKRN